ncbi:hypothetical protein ARMSODRAFT_463315 [Armillaria solidipes]|uniref:Uncharacterized protein n=1 Tax=Armillaria solidipes TaxID=1076256 RepID=A0A2H3B467_9AGAR|nr:hypothetical protein ARMSODRAFT_463315 [Armillaria solidipes]
MSEVLAPLERGEEERTTPKSVILEVWVVSDYCYWPSKKLNETKRQNQVKNLVHSGPCYIAIPSISLSLHAKLRRSYTLGDCFEVIHQAAVLQMRTVFQNGKCKNGNTNRYKSRQSVVLEDRAVSMGVVVISSTNSLRDQPTVLKKRGRKKLSRR